MTFLCVTNNYKRSGPGNEARAVLPHLLPWTLLQSRIPKDSHYLGNSILHVSLPMQSEYSTREPLLQRVLELHLNCGRGLGREQNTVTYPGTRKSGGCYVHRNNNNLQTISQTLSLNSVIFTSDSLSSLGTSTMATKFMKLPPPTSPPAWLWRKLSGRSVYSQG